MVPMAKIRNPTQTTAEKPGRPSLLLFENEQIHVWELIMKPGDVCNRHTHTDPHLLVVVDGASFDSAFNDGTSISATIPDHHIYVNPPGQRAEIAERVSRQDLPRDHHRF
jgi:hypothetical protein